MDRKLIERLALVGIGVLLSGLLLAATSTVTPIVVKTCSGSDFVNGIDATGTPLCATPSGSSFTGFFSVPSTGGTIPTSSNTGLTTWVNQSTASVADVGDGIILTSPAVSGNHVHLRTKTAPSTPYTIRVVLGIEATMPQPFQSCSIGWYDGTNKFQIATLHMDSLGVGMEVDNWTDPSTFSSSPVAKQYTNNSGGIFDIADDGTNFTFKQYRWGSPNPITLLTGTKSGGFLGSSGYSNIALAASRTNSTGSSDSVCHLLYWSQF